MQKFMQKIHSHPLGQNWIAWHIYGYKLKKMAKFAKKNAPKSTPFEKKRKNFKILAKNLNNSIYNFTFLV